MMLNDMTFVWMDFTSARIETQVRPAATDLMDAIADPLLRFELIKDLSFVSIKHL